MMDDISLLLKWGSENGVIIPENVSFVRDAKKGICCIANSDIENAEFDLPANLIISSKLSKTYFGQYANANLWLKFLFAKIKFGDKPVIIDGEDVKKKFQFYVNTLPSIVNSPLIWNPDELSFLSGTNLGNYIKEKFNMIFEEWKMLITSTKYKSHEIVIEQLKLDNNLKNIPYTQIYDCLISQVDKNDLLWFSFPAYLWSHLIFISRAFPERIVNEECEESDIILLPILDLLNHNYNSKIEWSSHLGSFHLCKCEMVPHGQEITNNYGGKSNEELLYSYGFMLENNPSNFVALKIKLPLEIIESIINQGLIKLPLLSEYITFAFEIKKNESETINKYCDGITYLIKKNENRSLNDMLDLFAYLEIFGNETHTSLRCKLQGLQKLKNALKHRISVLKMHPNYSRNGYIINSDRKLYAENYRKEQYDILKYALSELKNWEKAWSLVNNDKLITAKKIMKYDSKLIDIDLPFIFDGRDISFDSENDIILLWIILRSKENVLPYDRFRNIHQTYRKFTQYSDKIPEKTTYLYHKIFPQKNSQITPNDFHKAVTFLLQHSYSRLSTEEMIVVMD